MIATLALWISTLGYGEGIAPSAISPREFRSWYEAGLASNAPRLPRDVARQASEFRYVFVGGIRGETMRGYFARNTQELQVAGVPSDRIHLIAPSSSRTIEDNAAEVAQTLTEIAARGPERLVLLGTAGAPATCFRLPFKTPISWRTMCRPSF
jgi:hypothetical protein